MSLRDFDGWALLKISDSAHGRLVPGHGPGETHPYCPQRLLFFYLLTYLFTYLLTYLNITNLKLTDRAVIVTAVTRPGTVTRPAADEPGHGGPG